MNIDPTIARAAEEAVHRYIAAINAGDAGAVTDALNFPHFRIGMEGRVTHYPDRSADHLGNFRNRTAADGWKETVLDDCRTIFTAPTKAHVHIRFRRLRGDGSLIGAYESLYIVTCQAGHWGIQGGSGTGF